MSIGDMDLDREAAIEAARDDNGQGRTGARKGRKGSRDNAAAKAARGNRDRDLRRLLAGLRDLESGDFRVRLKPNGDALIAEIFDTFNEIADRNQRLCEEIGRVALVVGREGRMDERASIGRVGRG